LVSLKDIGFFKADSKYVVVKTMEAEYLINETLNQLEQELGDEFIRVHRNSLVSTRYLDGIEKIGNDKYQVFLHQFDEKLEVSRRQKPAIRSWIKNMVKR
jgi:two-component system response regulator AlgR